MQKRTKALQIPADVKRRVWERDGYCVYCGDPNAAPNAHYIARSQGGLGGIEQNILTLCASCHRRYDQSGERRKMRSFFREYLMSKYPGWSEDQLTYRREQWTEEDSSHSTDRTGMR